MLDQMTQEDPLAEAGLRDLAPTFTAPVDLPPLPRRKPPAPAGATRATFGGTSLNIPQGNWIIDPESYVKATQFAESTNNSRAVSRTGARGLMQVQPETGREIARKLGIPWQGRTTLDDPETNVKIGTEYLMRQLRRFGDWRKASVAYQAGPENVAKAIVAAREAGEPDNWFPYLRRLRLQSADNHADSARYLHNIARQLPQAPASE